MRARKFDPICYDCGERCSKGKGPRFPFVGLNEEILWRCVRCQYTRDTGVAVEDTPLTFDHEETAADVYLGGDKE